MYVHINADEDRTCTDVFCLIIGLVYSLTIFILAIVLFDYSISHFMKITFSMPISHRTLMEDFVELIQSLLDILMSIL